MTAEALASLFPTMAQTGYAITSPEDWRYNCIAWAVGDMRQWWEPLRGSYWPPGVPREYTLAAYTRVFAIHGYVSCDNAELEPGFEKVALFTNEEGAPTHAARQLASGIWASKLGELEDIEHTTLHALEGAAYGKVAQVMKRARR